MKPLSEIEFQLLAVLTTREQSGLAVGEAYSGQFGEIKMGTVYTTLRRMTEEGFVEVRDDRDEDGRVRFFKITGAGATAYRATLQYHKQKASLGVPDWGIV